MAFIRQADGDIQRDPAGDFRMGVMPSFVQFPDAGIILTPKIRALVGKLGQQTGSGQIQHMPGVDEQKRGFQHIAIHAELLLALRIVAKPHRLGAHITFQRQECLARHDIAVKGITGPQRPFMAQDSVSQP